MDTDEDFSSRRLPHLDGMSEQQNAIVTFLNAVCYVTDEQSKQLLFAKVCEHIGVEVIW